MEHGHWTTPCQKLTTPDSKLVLTPQKQLRIWPMYCLKENPWDHLLIFYHRLCFLQFITLRQLKGITNWQKNTDPCYMFPQCRGYQQRWSEVNFRKMRQNHIESCWGYKYAGRRDVILDFPLYIIYSSQWTWAESIEWFIEDKGFSPCYEFSSSSIPSSPLPFSRQQVVCLSQSFCGRGKGGEGGAKRRRKSLVLYKSFNILWAETLSVLERVAGRRYPRRRGRRPPVGEQRRGTGGRRRGWCSPTCPAGWRGGLPLLLSWLLVIKALPLRPALLINFVPHSTVTEGLKSSYI